MMIPVRCEVCGAISHMKRLNFAWGTFCGKCLAVEIKSDLIQLGQEDS